MMFSLDVVGLLEHGCRQVQPLQESPGSPVSQLLAQETSACRKIWPLLNDTLGQGQGHLKTRSANTKFQKESYQNMQQSCQLQDPMHEDVDWAHTQSPTKSNEVPHECL